MKNKKLAMIFPGQSSQRVGMLSSLATNFKIIKKTFLEVSEILKYDMWRLVQNGPTDQLNKTYYTQPAILTASVAIWRVWKEQQNLMPEIMAGHSLGEYSALVCSDSIDLLSAVELVKTRGILMQEAAPNGYGSMSVIIGLNDDIVLKLCKTVALSYNQIVSPACFNSVDNIVIAGQREAVNQVNILCKKAGAKYVLKLPISVPSHCEIMKSITNKFQEKLEKITIRTPKIPIINNTDVRIETKPEAIRKALIRQLYTPVRWNEIMKNLINDKKINFFLEVGPGKILTKLLQNTIQNDDALSLSINDPILLLKAMKICKN